MATIRFIYTSEYPVLQEYYGEYGVVAYCLNNSPSTCFMMIP